MVVLRGRGNNNDEDTGNDHDNTSNMTAYLGSRVLPTNLEGQGNPSTSVTTNREGHGTPSL